LAEILKTMMGSIGGDKRKSLLIGDEAPSFEAQTTMGKIKFPDDYQGKWIILFSHPADFTPVCTTEFVAFQKRFDQFEKLNTQLVGLSIDQVFAHIKWVQWIKENLETEIKFPVIADDRGKIAEMFGMIHPAKAANTVRAVFIIDPQRIIRLIIYYPQEVGRNFDEILRVLKALQTVDENKVSTPANWPNNELIGDEVIVPPPKDVEAADKRRDEYDCYDWWFCHKKL
jgi:peroxiredoxin (alkyl hydroperoxide reductase subunit C)